MSAGRSTSTTSRWPHRLASRLLLALLAITVLLGFWLLFVVSPGFGILMSGFGKATLLESAETMREVSSEQTRQSSQVLVDLIRHTASARARALQDLPLESLGGDVEAMRAAIVAEDSERSQRQRRNVEVLANEMQRRADRDMNRRLDELTKARSRREATLVRNLTRTHLTLVAVTLSALLLVLGFGLHRFVVRPTLRLRAATQRVARGEHEVDLPAVGPGELGDLTRDFGGMLAQLQQSRGDLQHLADNLEVEVRNKTRDLEASHRQLAQSERLAALGTLAGGFAHEFHNVIGGIRGCADELLADEANAERRETLEVVVRASERAAGIVQQLQRFARQPSHQHAPLDVTAVLQEALRLCEPAARRQSVAIERAFPGDASLVGSEAGLHQVFVNLFVNALQAMPDGGTLTVRATRRDDQIQITVRDTGPGISPDALPHVFDPFFTTRADAPHPDARGTGLGLSVSYGIITEHQGTIRAHSEAGSGATFEICLPGSS